MNRATSAKTVKSKLRQLERIHSKVITYTSFHYKFNQSLPIGELVDSLKNLKALIECMSKNLASKYSEQYLEAINSAILIASETKTLRDHRIHKLLCNLYGSFVKFRKDVFEQINRGCEIEFQTVCTPLLILEIQLSERKKLTRMRTLARD